MRHQFGVEVCKNLRQHRAYARKCGVPEEEPGETDKVERQHNSRCTPPPMRTIVTLAVQNLLTKILVCHQPEAVNAAPNHKIEAGSVPQSAKQHGDNKVHILSYLALSVASERDIDVVANPRRQRNVPPPPEVSNAVAFVRSVEVHRKAETQQQCNADGHVAIAAEVAVNLHGITVYSQQIFEARVKRWVVKDAVNKV